MILIAAKSIIPRLGMELLYHSQEPCRLADTRLDYNARRRDGLRLRGSARLVGRWC
jgi:hypothetical protein